MRSTICCFRMRCSTRSRRQIDRLVQASRDLFPGVCRRRAAALAGPALQLRGRDPSRAAARRRPEGLSAELPRVLRAPPFHLGRRRRRPVDRGRRARRPVRRRPAVRRRRRVRVSPFMSKSARICGCRSRRAARRRRPAPRSCSTCPPATSRSARRRCAGCCAPRNRRAASPPTPIPPPAPAN